MTIILVLSVCAIVFCFFKLYRFKRWRDSLRHQDALASVQAVAVHKGKKKQSRKPARKTARKPAKRTQKTRSVRKRK